MTWSGLPTPPQWSSPQENSIPLWELEPGRVHHLPEHLFTRAKKQSLSLFMVHVGSESQSQHFITGYV